MSLSTFTSDPFFAPVGHTWDPFDSITTTPTGRKRTYNSLDKMKDTDNLPGINIDFLEMDNKYLVKADMPGYDKVRFSAAVGHASTVHYTDVFTYSLL